MANTARTIEIAQQALADPNVTPNQLLVSMRAVLASKKPIGYDTVHKTENYIINKTGIEKPTDNIYDRYEHAFDEYQTWIDGWRSGKNAQSDYAKLQTVGKQILKSEVDTDIELMFNQNTPLTQAAEASRDFVKRSATKAAAAVVNVGSDLGSVAFKLVLAYVVTTAISNSIMKK